MSGDITAVIQPIVLTCADTQIVVDTHTFEQPYVPYWGPQVLAENSECARSDAIASIPQRVSGGVDSPSPLTLVPQAASGWLSTPAIEGHRAGYDFVTKLVTNSVEAAKNRVKIKLVDGEAGLSLTLDIGLTLSGLLYQQAHLTNDADADYTLDALRMFFPLPGSAVEVLDTTGHHLRERSPQRHNLTIGKYQRESRRGRPGADSPLLLAAGTKGFGFESGLVHGIHLGWSGSQRLSVELTTAADRFLVAEELFEPGEMILEPGQTYSSPVSYGAWGDGLNAVSARFHQHLRSRATHPSSPRPVTLNTWEAVYFDHDFDKLASLADRAARVGAERYVLDDGWFSGRRDDTAGLGDWFVDQTVWPKGLHPLVGRVRQEGMEFGLWVEPEMVNPDSDLARRHPEWILKGREDLPVAARQQQVLNLTNPDAYRYVRDRLLALLREYPISYLKWDHNRDLLEAGSGAGGRALAHRQTKALYNLLQELKEHQPGLEIESCASGGARIDMGIAEYTDRFHPSDCLDPQERLANQKYTGLVMPPELLGAHLTAPKVHSTGRIVDLEFSAAVALLGHFGIEWDLTGADDATLDEVSRLVEFYKQNRELISTGTVVHADLSDPALDVRGVVSEDKRNALFTITQVTTSAFHPLGMVHFPGLDPKTVYRVQLALAGGDKTGPGQSEMPWLAESMELPGAALMHPGVRAPAQNPENSLIIRIEAAK